MSLEPVIGPSKATLLGCGNGSFAMNLTVVTLWPWNSVGLLDTLKFIEASTPPSLHGQGGTLTPMHLLRLWNQHCNNQSQKTKGKRTKRYCDSSTYLGPGLVVVCRVFRRWISSSTYLSRCTHGSKASTRFLIIDFKPKVRALMISGSQIRRVQSSSNRRLINH